MHCWPGYCHITVLKGLFTIIWFFFSVIAMESSRVGRRGRMELRRFPVIDYIGWHILDFFCTNGACNGYTVLFLSRDNDDFRCALNFFSDFFDFLFMHRTVYQLQFLGFLFFMYVCLAVMHGGFIISRSVTKRERGKDIGGTGRKGSIEQGRPWGWKLFRWYSIPPFLWLLLHWIWMLAVGEC